MTIHVAATTTISTGMRYALVASDVLSVEAGVTLGSTSTHVIAATGADIRIGIMGSLSALAPAPTIFAEGAVGLVVTIGETGSLWALADAGVGAVALGQGAWLDNRGSITATDGLGVVLSGADALVTNTGSITGQTGGIFMGLFGVTGQTLVNHGRITAGSLAPADNRSGHAVQIEGADTLIQNHGIVEATAAGGNGIHLGGDGPSVGGIRIENAGLVSSARDWGIDGFDNTGSALLVLNTGTIAGAAGAVRSADGAARVVNDGVLRFAGPVTDDTPVASFGSGADAVINRGRILGDVALGGGNDRFVGTQSVLQGTVDGGAGADLLTGGAAADRLVGGTSNDTLQGLGGDDVLEGGAGNEVMRGGFGEDTLTGGAGGDRMTGGADADVFVFAARTEFTAGPARDRITDFQAGIDEIDLSAFMRGGSFIGSAAFGGRDGQVRYVAATGTLQGDVDGNRTADWTLTLDNRPAGLTAGDFIFA